MNRRVLTAIALLTVFACIIFTAYNPTIAQNYTGNFSDGEIFTPQNGQFDFGDFFLNSTKAENFTAKIISNGHIKFVDNTGNITVNYMELDRMIRINRDMTNSFLNGELQKPSWSVDGVAVHEIDFTRGALYSAYYKDSSENAIIYISTSDERETADLMNSLRFN